MFLSLWGKGVSGREVRKRGQELQLPAAVMDIAEDGILYFSGSGAMEYENPRARALLEGSTARKNFNTFLDFIKETGKSLSLDVHNTDAIEGFTCLLEVDGRRLRVRGARLENGGLTVILTNITESLAFMKPVNVPPDKSPASNLSGELPEVQMAQRQFQSQKLEALGQLAGGVAHDFNNLLSIIDGYTRMALKHVEVENPANNYLERIKQANRRGAALTKQLLTFGRHKIVAESAVDIGALLVEQEPLLHPLLNASINLFIDTAEGACVECAADGIAQILMNLVINARDAMPEGGSIIIDVSILDWGDLPLSVPLDRKKDRFVCLSITDTGTGMDQETQARIFDPFFTTKEQGKGSGLGLSMVYGIVRQFGGVIDVHSALEEGTSFQLYFPLSDKLPERKRSIVKGIGTKAVTRFEGYTALLAEDEPDLLFVLGSMLEDMGMNVIKATDGNDALVKQDDFKGDIDFLLTDVVMPELNGVRLAEMMEEIRPETKIIFMSGYPANGAMTQVQLPENAWLLAKPVEYEKLAGVLEERPQSGTQAESKSTRGLYRWQSAGSDAA